MLEPQTQHTQPDNEAIDAPHPVAIANIQIIERTGWWPADDCLPDEKTGKQCVEACVADYQELDDFDGVMKSKPVVLHRFYDRKRKKWNGDRAATTVSADGMIDQRHSTGIVRPGLKTRFGSHLRAYERWLVENGEDIPLDFIGDKIYPESVKTMLVMDILTIQELASISDAQLNQLSSDLQSQKHPLQARRAREFRDIARKRLEDLGAEVPRPSPEPEDDADATEPKTSASTAKSKSGTSATQSARQKQAAA